MTMRTHINNRSQIALVTLSSFVILVSSFAVTAPPYRIEGGDEKLPWYQIKPGEFPPPDAAHRETATLTWSNPYLRTGEYRPDSRVTDHLIRMTPFTVLPCATILFHGAPADLRDIPPGTHVHLQLFLNADKNDFTQVIALADDFSTSVAIGESYRVEELKLDQRRIILSRQSATAATNAKSARVEFIVDARTRLWKSRGFAEEKDLAIGQTVLVNLAVGTANLPVFPRCTDLWLDQESRTLATDRQRVSNLVELKKRGLPAYIETVDNHNPMVTLTLFASGYPELFKDLHVGKKAKLAVADESTRTIEPAGGQGGPDAIESEIIEIKSVPVRSGSSGFQIILKPQILLEGFRPRRVVRLAPPGFDILPAEEHLEY